MHLISKNRTNQKQVDFIAVLSFKKSEDGGRITPATSGYRPMIKFSPAKHFASWLRLAPNNRKSGGKWHIYLKYVA